MANISQLMAYSRNVVGDYYDREGKRIKPYPTKKWLKKGVATEEANDFLREYVKLLMTDGGFLHRDTQVWLMYPELTQFGVGVKMYELGYSSEVKNGNSVKSMIHADREKMMKYFPTDMLLRVVDYPGTDLSPYWVALQNAKAAVKPDTAWKNLRLDLPDCRGVEGKVTDEQFMEFYQVIAPYTAGQMQFIQDNIDHKVLGYAQRLLDGTDVSPEDRDKRELLLGLLGSSKG